MKLLIHDLTPEEWARVAAEYDGWTVIADDGTIKPCVGCFGCWIKTPGVCVIRDGYARCGQMIHEADEVLVLSRYTNGGFSAFVKNVFDRSIGWVLPYFEVVDGEMHHQKRYPEIKTLSVRFRGDGLTDADRAQGRRYVEAVCRNFRGRIGEITFEACAPTALGEPAAETAPGKQILLLNASPRGKRANSLRLLRALGPMIPADHEIVNVPLDAAGQDALIERLRAAGTIVLAAPLFVDGLPSSVIRFLERLAAQLPGGGRKVYVVTNMGLYEAHQQQNLLWTVRDWCNQSGYDNRGALAVGAGAMLSNMVDGAWQLAGPGKHAVAAMKTLGAAIAAGRDAGELYVEPHAFPRAVYITAANASWPRKAKKNGLKKAELRTLRRS